MAILGCATILQVLVVAHLALSIDSAKPPLFNESTATTPSPGIVSRVRQHRFGLYSYFFTQSTSATLELSEFAAKYGISDIVQYACLGIPPAHFANFVDMIHGRSGTTITVLFDNTMWPEAHASPYSIDAKLAWYRKVVDLLIDYKALAGVSFDIEGLSSGHYLSLFDETQARWKAHGLSAYGRVGFNLGSTEASTAAKAISTGAVDRIYWENYRNTEGSFYDFAESVLQDIQLGSGANSNMVLAVNTICCSNPCVKQDTCSGTACRVPGTHVFKLRESRSFCRQNYEPENSSTRMSPAYLLDTLDKVRATLYKKYTKVLQRTPFYIYDYRAFKIFLEGADTVHAMTCPAPEILNV